MVCDRGLTLGDLIGILQLFFSRLGLKKLRFKPAFNPYTEPSMEIFSYSEQLKKWVEVRASPAPAFVAAFLRQACWRLMWHLRPDTCSTAQIWRHQTSDPHISQHAALLRACMLRMLFSLAYHAGGQ